MIPYRPDARGEILRAAVILHVRIESFEIVDVRRDPGSEERDVAITLTLLAVLKGSVPEAPSATLRLQVTPACGRPSIHPRAWNSSPSQERERPPRPTR